MNIPQLQFFGEAEGEAFLIGDFSTGFVKPEEGMK